jgi:hypothetical protein
MIKELSQLTYGYRVIVEGCYDTTINNYKIEKPSDLSKDQIIDKSLEILNRRSI